MKIILSFVISLFCFMKISYSQTFFQTYGGPEDDMGWSLFEDANGNFVVAGDSGSGTWPLTSDIILLKFDPYGNSFWRRNYGDNDDQVARCVRQTIDGGFILAGDNSDMAILMKIDSTGDSLWSRLDMGGDLGSRGKSVLALPNGSFIFGSRWDDIQTSNPYLILKVDQLGQNIWQYPNAIASSSNGGEGPSSLIESHDSCYIGVSSEMVGFYIRNKVTISKISDNGNFVWNKNYDAGTDWQPVAVIECTDHSLMIVGSIIDTIPTPSRDMFVMKCDSTGDSLWVKTFGGSGVDILTDIKQTNDGGFIAFGYSNTYSSSYDALLLRLDAQGDSVWQRTMGGAADEIVNSGIICQNGDYAFTGSTTSFGAGNEDIIIYRTDSLGNLSTNISDTKKPAISIYPNPVSNNLKISLFDNTNGKISIYSINGTLIYQSEISSKEISINTTQWSNGFYFCTIDQKGIQNNFKIVKID